MTELRHVVTLTVLKPGAGHPETVERVSTTDGRLAARTYARLRSRVARGTLDGLRDIAACWSVNQLTYRLSYMTRIDSCVKLAPDITFVINSPQAQRQEQHG